MLSSFVLTAMLSAAPYKGYNNYCARLSTEGEAVQMDQAHHMAAQLLPHGYACNVCVVCVRGVVVGWTTHFFGATPETDHPMPST